jgi:hypothetical protein
VVPVKTGLRLAGSTRILSRLVRQVVLGHAGLFELVDPVLIPARCRAECFVLGILSWASGASFLLG